MIALGTEGLSGVLLLASEDTPNAVVAIRTMRMIVSSILS
tara:strand:+ start:35415 stop:35534 length:120 start_codon:yes stop_codon:yes gene_type:complete